MSLLPQRKKSAEEIAQLRESLGIPGGPPGEEELPAEIPVTKAAPVKTQKEAGAVAIPEAAAVEPTAEPLIYEPKEVRSLRRSERIAVLPADGDAVAEEPASTLLPVAREPKVVRSLRKSEQGPVSIPRAQTSGDSKLPAHRHSDREISEIRRQEAIGMMAPSGPPRPLAAHPVLVIPGYLFAAAGGVGFHFYNLELPVTAGCVVAALLIALFVFIRKPLSRHHAAFISVACLFVIVFGALHYFPHLNHGT